MQLSVCTYMQHANSCCGQPNAGLSYTKQCCIIKANTPTEGLVGRSRGAHKHTVVGNKNQAMYLVLPG